MNISSNFISLNALNLCEETYGYLLGIVYNQLQPIVFHSYTSFVVFKNFQLLCLVLSKI
jgi:hypothetical protein